MSVDTLPGWASIAQGREGEDKRSENAAARLATAFIQVFAGKPSAEDQQLVLAELAAYTHYFQFDARGIPDAELRYIAGMRAVFGRVLNDLTLTDTQMLALTKAARIESRANNELGDFV